MLTDSARRLPRQRFSPPPQKNVPLILKSIFFPPLPTAFKVMLLLPAVPDGHKKLCLHPTRLVGIQGRTHTHTQVHIEGGERKYWVWLVKSVKSIFFFSFMLLEILGRFKPLNSNSSVNIAGKGRLRSTRNAALTNIWTCHFLVIHCVLLPPAVRRGKVTGGLKAESGPVTADVLKGSSLWRVKRGVFFLSLQNSTGVRRLAVISGLLRRIGARDAVRLQKKGNFFGRSIFRHRNRKV